MTRRMTHRRVFPANLGRCSFTGLGSFDIYPLLMDTNMIELVLDGAVK